VTTVQRSDQKADIPWELTQVPPFPAVAIKALEVVSSEYGRMRELSNLIVTDAALSGEILRIANSPLFGVRKEIVSIFNAIVLLGLERIKGVVATVAMKSYLGGSLEVPALRACWRHSLACAIISGEFAKLNLMDVDTTYTAGLLHDIGRLAMVTAYPRKYANFLTSTEEERSDTLQRERDLFGIDHCQAGGLMVSQWNLPKSLIAVASRHHDQTSAGEPAVLATVRHSCMMADALGFTAISSAQVRTYEEILNEVPAAERCKLPTDSSEFYYHIAGKINSIETC